MIRIDTASFTPFYEQIKQQIRGQIGTGDLSPGAPLPSIRDLALSLLLNPNTVARAYRDLEREGIVTTRRGLGVFLSENAAKLCRDGRREDIRAKLEEVAAEARRAGISGAELREEIERALSDAYARSKAKEK
jgi:GntR family transcriptional regulator